MSRIRQHGLRSVVAGVVTAAALLAPAAIVGSAAAHGSPARMPHYTLTILHNNDGESRLTGLPGNPDFGGIARFASLVDQVRQEAVRGRPPAGQSARRGVVLLSSGDNFLPGPEFQASIDRGVPFYDSMALDRIGYDALAIGNHEFDFGPDVLADFIDGFGSPVPPFLSANLDVSDEPRLHALAVDGTVVASTVIRERGELIGVVGATTPLLPAISSPRNVKVLDDVAGLVQDQVDALTGQGVNKIILASHLQNINEEIALVPLLRDVDVVIGGGGGELLANDDDLLIPGDARTLDPVTGEPFSYPIIATDTSGAQVPIVTTSGEYKYLGRLVVSFDRDGTVVDVGDNSGPLRISGVAPDAVRPDPWVQRNVVDPVASYVESLSENVIAQSEVALEGRRAPGVRTEETNLGNLIADSLRAAGVARAAEFGVTPPDVAIQNGGGIRNESLLPAGAITELTTYSIAPFSNFVSVVPDVPRAQFKEIVENLVSSVPLADGRFGQVSGFRFSYDASRTAQVVDNDGNVLTAGERVRSLQLDDGTVIVADGAVQPGAPVAIATNDFSARGGDQYPFRGLSFTTVGLTYQQALARYLVEDLGGAIRAADYPEGGEGRIVRAG